ncbi:MAG: hypothetical protein QHJ73_05140 [Armatimonadota bacterium]|nr:hypothetical protein [Armatimonadota bacterium]
MVTVTGTVVGGTGWGGHFFGGQEGVFLLDDGTGKVVVTSHALPPAKGARVTVRARVEVVGILEVPDAWLRSLSEATGIPLDGVLTGVILHALQVWER